MSIIPKITCKKCKREYSGLNKKCPHCHAVRQTASPKAAPTSDRAQNRKMTDENAKWQFGFGVTIVSAVMLSVIVLITSNVGEGGENADELVDPLASAPPITITPPPVATPTPTPVTPPDSIDIYYLTEPSEGFTMAVGDAPLQLSAQYFPLTINATIEWISSDTNVFTVDSTGAVTAVGPGSATLTVNCAGVTDTIPVFVKAVTT